MVSDKIWLSTKNITTDQPSKKLDYKILDLFEVKGNKRVFIELQLLKSMKIYNIFHPNLFQKTSIDLLTNQVNELPPPIIINNEQKWVVKDIFDAKSH